MTTKDILKKIYSVSKKLKTPAYVVGGFVRDEIHGIPHEQDIDVVVEGSGVAFARAFAEGMAEDTGSLVEFLEFDTARYIVRMKNLELRIKNGQLGDSVSQSELRTPSPPKRDPVLMAGNSELLEIEFAGARVESYRSASRKPSVTPATLEQDLSRRDFTVNAMARKVLANGRLGVVIDPFGGEEDVRKKVLRTPLHPNETFSDDPLRILRAGRFAAQLGFAVEMETLSAMKRHAERLTIVSAERVQEELSKLLAAPKPSIGLWILVQTGVMARILPEVAALDGVEDLYGHRHKNNLSHSIQVVDNIAERSESVLLRLAGLLHDVGKPSTKRFVRGRGWTFDMHEHVGKKMARQIGRRLRFSADDTEYIAKLVRWHMHPINLMDEGVTDSAVRRLIVTLKDDLLGLLILCRSDITTGNPQKKERRLKNYDYLERRIAEVIETDKLRVFQSPVRGEEIMEACGLKPGPTVGKIKKAIEEAILEGVIPNEYEGARGYFDQIKDAYVEKAEGWERV